MFCAKCVKPTRSNFYKLMADFEALQFCKSYKKQNHEFCIFGIYIISSEYDNSSSSQYDTRGTTISYGPANKKKMMSKPVADNELPFQLPGKGALFLRMALLSLVQKLHQRTETVRKNKSIGTLITTRFGVGGRGFF